jgi:FtsZ-binding cell division protein ZapB
MKGLSQYKLLEIKKRRDDASEELSALIFPKEPGPAVSFFQKSVEDVPALLAHIEGLQEQNNLLMSEYSNAYGRIQELEQTLGAVRTENHRLEESLDEECRLNGMGSEREAKLLTENEQLKNRMALRKCYACGEMRLELHGAKMLDENARLTEQRDWLESERERIMEERGMAYTENMRLQAKVQELAQLMAPAGQGEAVRVIDDIVAENARLRAALELARKQQETGNPSLHDALITIGKLLAIVERIPHTGTCRGEYVCNGCELRKEARAVRAGDLKQGKK